MPAKSKEQQRLFGWVHAYQKGECKDAPENIKDIANSISKKDAKEFAETKHKGLPEKVKHKKKMNENRIQITESDIREMVYACINEVSDALAAVERRKQREELFNEIKAKLEPWLTRGRWEISGVKGSDPNKLVLALYPVPSEEDLKKIEAAKAKGGEEPPYEAKVDIGLLASTASEVLGGKRVTPRDLKDGQNPKMGLHFLEINL